MEKRLLNTQEAAEYLGLSMSDVYNLLYLKRIPAMKIGKRWKIPKDALDTWIDTNVKNRAHISSKK